MESVEKTDWGAKKAIREVGWLGSKEIDLKSKLE